MEWPAFVFEILRFQFQALFSLDFVSESLTFVLMGFIGAFVYLFDQESCEQGLSKDKIHLKEENQVNSLEKLIALNNTSQNLNGS